MKKLVYVLVILTTLLRASEEVPAKEEVAKLYVATFNRAPDFSGLNYWTNDSGLRLSQIAESFFDQPETRELYPSGNSNRSFIQSVYANLFNREPDTAGWNYWEDELNSNRFSKNSFILAVINGAQDNDISHDKTILENKTKVGLSFSEAKLSDMNDAKSILVGVSDDETTITSAVMQFGISLYGNKSSANVAPIANAGEDLYIYVGGEVYLDASNSSDNDGKIVSYEWKENDIVLSTKSSFYKSDLSVGVHTITLIVMDDDGEISSDTVSITVEEGYGKI